MTVQIECEASKNERFLATRTYIMLHASRQFFARVQESENGKQFPKPRVARTARCTVRHSNDVRITKVTKAHGRIDPTDLKLSEKLSDRFVFSCNKGKRRFDKSFPYKYKQTVQET